MRVRKFWIVRSGLMLAASVAACGGGSKHDLDEAPAGSAGGGGGPKVDADDRGRHRWRGYVRRRRAEKRADQDERRSGLRERKPYAAATGNIRGRRDGKLANVFVYVKDGLGNYRSMRRPSR